MTDFGWPDALKPSGSSFWLQPHTGGSESPFSRVTKTYGLSAPRWQCSLSFKVVRGSRWGDGPHVAGHKLDALVTKLKGRLNRIALYDFDFPAPQGALASAGGNLLAVKGATQMTITGMTPGATVIGGKSYIGGDGRPHVVTDDVTVDGSGNATVSFEPPLQLDIAANAAIFAKVTGLFRLASDDQGQNFNENDQAIPYSLQFVEDPLEALPLPLYGLAGLWVMSDRVSAPSPAIPNRVSTAKLGANIFRAPRRLFSDAGLWHAVNATVVDNAVAGPDGIIDASTLVGTGDWSLAPYWNNPVIPAGTYTRAISVRRNTGSDQVFAFTKDGGATRSSVKTATAAWQRFSYTFTLGSTGAPSDIRLCSSNGSTNASLQIRDDELFAGSADLGPVGPDTHIYLGHVPTMYEGSYAAGVQSECIGFLQFPSAIDISGGFTAQYCVKVSGAGYNAVLSDAKDNNNLPLASQGVLGPMGLANSTSISNRNGTGTTGETFQYPDLFDLVADGQPHIITYSYDRTALELWVDDARMFRQEEVYSRQARDFFFGTVGFGAGPGSNKYSGFLALWTRALSSAEIRQSYAVQKSLASSTGVTVTGDTADRIYVAEGDSISGGNGEDCYTFRYGAHDSPQVFGTVWANAGSKLADLNARAARVDAVIPPNRHGRKFLLSVLIGANDLFNYPGANDTAAANAYAAALAAYCDARRAAGFKVVVCTILPTASAAHNTRRAIVNAAITSGWAGVHCDGIADFAADANMGPDSAALNATYYADTVHPTSAGYAILETIIRPVLNGL